MLWYNKKKRFVLKNDYLCTHESDSWRIWHQTSNLTPTRRGWTWSFYGSTAWSTGSGAWWSAAKCWGDGRVVQNDWLTPFPPTICCPIRITITEQRKDSEILDAGEREHEEMSDITAIWLLKRHKVTHVWKKVVISVQSFLGKWYLYQ